MILFGTIAMGNAQMGVDPELYKTLRSKDILLFDASFNPCDVESMEGMFTEDLGFYHDKGRLTQGRKAFLGPTRQNCEKREPGTPQAFKRILLENSLEVYPLYEIGKLYGAIQTGTHRFEFLNGQGIREGQ